MLNSAVGILLLNIALSWHVYKHLHSQCTAWEVDGPRTHFTDMETEALGDELMCPKVSQLVSSLAGIYQSGSTAHMLNLHPAVYMLSHFSRV